MEKTEKKKNTVRRIERERADFKKLIIQNPNYFGTLPKVKLKSVKKMKSNKKYEEIKCMGFYPEEDLLEVIINVKLPYGYKGDLCSAGSFEYVRFFVDWNGDGYFNDPDDDVGIASVNVHDIPEIDDPCLDKTKPLSYAVRLKLDPKKLFCTTANLVKVRAILSWEAPPTAGNPNYIPVWGNVVEEWIQIKPAKWFLKDIVRAVDLAELNIKSSMLDLELPVSKTEALSSEELKEIYKDDVPEYRYNFAKISQVADKIELDPGLMAEYKLNPQFKEITKNIDAVFAEKANTKYEELECLGLNYNLDTLAATLTVKLPLGYKGNLCTKGSYEYVAFWAYVWDQIEQQCSWTYLGTSRVNVHDISNIPPKGLKYAVNLSVDLSSLRDKCFDPRVIKVRAILSWETPPSATNPDYNPVWGNKFDAFIQIKPGVQAFPGEQKPIIWAAGNMAVESISGNPYTVVPSSLGDGYANGPSIGGGFNALESPFGGVIAISGTISNPPNNPAEIDKLKYKVQYKKLGEPHWKEIKDKFRIWIRIDSVPSGHMDQVADPGGYFTFQKDLSLPTLVEVQNDIMAQWRTPVSEGDGLYDIRILLYKLGAAPQLDVPADHIASNVVKIKIDNTAPDAEVSLDAGPCEKFTVGDTFTGKFTATDPHIWKYTLRIEPTVVVGPTIFPSDENYPALPAPGRTDEVFTVTTTSSTTPCGYVIKLRVWDRTIRNNHMHGNFKPDDVGLCLLEEEE